MIVKPANIFLTMCLAFIVFSSTIYIKPYILNQYKKNPELKASSDGRLVWQKYNCQSCHQLYGLGGYLGPDLTNVYSAQGKGELFINAMLKTGTPKMPVFHLSEIEQTQLIAFLKTTDASGSADPRNFTTLYDGMILAK